mgnify:CR=1 FL=1
MDFLLISMPMPLKSKFSQSIDKRIHPDPIPISKSFNFLLNLVIFKISSIIISVSGLGINTSLGAIALGASIIEKHFTAKKNYKGPDISSSIDQNELKELIKGAEEIFQARGGEKKALSSEKKTINFDS